MFRSILVSHDSEHLKLGRQGMREGLLVWGSRLKREGIRCNPWGNCPDTYKDEHVFELGTPSRDGKLSLYLLPGRSMKGHEGMN